MGFEVEDATDVGRLLLFAHSCEATLLCMPITLAAITIPPS
jgi:hypothetical protein